MEPLTVPGTLDSLSAIAKYVMAAAAAVGLDKKATYNLRLAVDEIATNIIIHGYEEASIQGVLDLRAEIDEKALTIFIEDTGVVYNPYDTETVEEKEFKLPLEERKLGGLGVYLAIQGVDKFSYERVFNRNRNIFVMNRLSA
ncbi:MAG TPA: ATP-binding protein [Candidatus Obscuribacterales bacterium]